MSNSLYYEHQLVPFNYPRTEQNQISKKDTSKTNNQTFIIGRGKQERGRNDRIWLPFITFPLIYISGSIGQWKIQK